MKTVNRDIRERIVAARKEGCRAEDVARLFRVSRRSVERFWHDYCATGTVKPKQRGGYRRSCLADHDERLRAWINEDMYLTLAELREHIQRDLGINVSNTALWFRMERLGLTYKKNRQRCLLRMGAILGRPPKLMEKTHANLVAALLRW